MTCDHCGPYVKAAYCAEREGSIAVLYLCGHCASKHQPALVAKGWTLSPVDIKAIAPQGTTIEDVSNLWESDV